MCLVARHPVFLLFGGCLFSALIAALVLSVQSANQVIHLAGSTPRVALSATIDGGGWLFKVQTSVNSGWLLPNQAFHLAKLEDPDFFAVRECEGIWAISTAGFQYVRWDLPLSCTQRRVALRHPAMLALLSAILVTFLTWPVWTRSVRSVIQRIARSSGLQRTESESLAGDADLPAREQS